MPVSFIAHTVIMVLLSCKLQLVCFFYVLHFLLRSISIYQTTDGKRDSHSLLLKSSSVCTEKAYCWSVAFFFSPLYQAELQEVVGEEEAEDVSSTSSAPAESSKGETPESPAAQVQYTLLLPNLKLTPSTCLLNGRFFCLLPVTEKKGKPTCWGFIKLAAYLFIYF